MVAKRPRRNHSPAFKAKVALAAVQGDKTLVELSEHFAIHANQLTQWKRQLLTRASEAFEGSGPSAPPVDVKNTARQNRHIDIGERFFRGCAQQGRPGERKKMIDPAHSLPLTKQAAALGISRSSIYYLPQPVSERDQAL